MARIEIQPTLTYRAEAFKGGEKFLFTFLNVESLPDKDCLGSKSDAYFRIKVPGNSTRKTPPILNSSHPVWERDNGFVFRGGVGTVIELVCMDWHPEGYDDDVVTGIIELTDAILDGEEQRVVLKQGDESSSSEDEAVEGEEGIGDVSSQLKLVKKEKNKKENTQAPKTENVQAPKLGQIIKQGRLLLEERTGGFRTSPGKQPVETKAKNKIKRVWEDNKVDIINRWDENLYGEKNNKSAFWEDKKTGLRLDLQSTDKDETRFALQEGKNVHGQVHLVHSTIPKSYQESDKDKTVATALWEAMKMSLETGNIWNVKGNEELEGTAKKEAEAEELAAKKLAEELAANALAKKKVTGNKKR